MKEYYPPRMRGTEIGAWQDAVQPLMDGAWSDRDGFAAQLVLATATWGLTYWEAAVGVSPAETDSYTLRRDRVRARLLGMSTSTVERIREIANAFGVTATVDEDNGNYRFVIAFPGTVGAPEAIYAIRDAINNAKPAHLEAVYQYIYRTWGQVRAAWTWGALKNYTWAQVKGDEPL